MSVLIRLSLFKLHVYNQSNVQHLMLGTRRDFWTYLHVIGLTVNINRHAHGPAEGLFRRKFPYSCHAKFHVNTRICLWISIIRTNFTIVHNWNNGTQYTVCLVSLRNYQAEGLFVTGARQTMEDGKCGAQTRCHFSHLTLIFDYKLTSKKVRV